MLKKIAIAALLLQVAGFSALITQTLLLSSGATRAADVQPSPDPIAAQCAKAVWPDIPAHYLQRVEARSLTGTMMAQ
ncbi:conserved exported hypothetical protein [Mesorhizobium sp. SOD10]|nr:conserved exported hypothetical protein [Mesorhizobium sp. SOD10]